jgi:hypothetical protein
MSVTDDRFKNGVGGPGRASIAERTLRGDRWWLAPLTTFVVFSSFIVYATWRAFTGGTPQSGNYQIGDYLSPFYSPGFPLSAALIILIFPLGFRMTCYYYRKSYYRAFWLSPPACAVAEPHTKYTGETRLPLILNNLHRYFWYAAIAVGVILSYDTVLSFQDFGIRGRSSGHVGLGSLIMVVNIALIWLYTLSCHSCRHAMGGRLRHFSAHPVRYKLWTWVSKINVHHAKFAWYSLFSVALADLYVMLLANGTIQEARFF